MDIGEILREVVQTQASDLHLAVGLPPVVRVDGHLRNLEGYPELTANEARELIYSILNQDQRQKLETDWEVDLSYSLYGQARFRVNAFFHKGTLAAAFRLIPVNIKTIDELALPKVLHTFCHKPRGFVLVTGPTGSGKSTTLAAIIDEINETQSGPHRHHRGPHRVPAHPQALRGEPARGGERHEGLSAVALRSALRQDPDVILIGEMRDLETIQIALDRGRDRPPGVRHASHAGLPADHRPHHRRLPASPAGADPGADSRHPRRRRHAAAPAQDFRSRTGGRLRSPDIHACGQEPHPRRARPTSSTRSCRPAASTACRR